MNQSIISVLINFLTKKKTNVDFNNISTSFMIETDKQPINVKVTIENIKITVEKEKTNE